MRIAIIGCGWVGKRLAKYLTDKNHYVIATTTSSDKIADLQKLATEVHLLDFNSTQNFDFLDHVDLAIFSMPISRDGWLEGFKNLNQKFPKTILFSSTGIYPKETKTFTEKDTENLRPDISNAENLVKGKYPQTTILRFGGLMGDERSLKKIYQNRTPDHPQKKANYIHYEDILQVVELVIHSEKSGEIYNVVAPEHPSVAGILNLETDRISVNLEENPQRIISSEHLIQDFNYTFIHPNPKYF